MSFAALLTTRAFRPTAQNPKIPLAERCPGDGVGFLSVGEGGLTSGVITFGKHGPVISKVTVGTQPPNPTSFSAAAKAMRKSIRSWGKTPLVIGCSYKLEWTVKGNLDIQTQEDFAYKIRTDMRALIGSPTEGLTYTGLLLEGQGTAVIMGVGKNELATHEELVRPANCEPVRRVIPILAVLNLLLADPRVKDEGFIPLVVDQGYVVAVLGGMNGWQEAHGRRFVGQNFSTDLIGEMVSRIQSTTAEPPRFLVANSGTNAGAPVDEALDKAGVERHVFRIGNLKPEEIFVYASALF